MQSVPDIDSIYFARDQQLVNNGTESDGGIIIYLDSKPGNNNQYYRWSYTETWKFAIHFPKIFNLLIKIPFFLYPVFNNIAGKHKNLMNQ